MEKTAAPISDLERGKVQVSATDLAKLADYLNKPVEYFYGEEFVDEDIQDLIALLRKQPKEVRIQSIITTQMLLQMQTLKEMTDANPEKQLSFDEIKDFFAAFLTFSKQMNDLNSQLTELRKKC